MAFFKFRSRDPQAEEGSGRKSATPAAAPAESVEAMRRRARHRLLGAAVLVLLGVIGFPLLFDTQPRPIAENIAIEIPDRSNVPPLVPPAASSASESTPAAGGDAQQALAPRSGDMITESADGTVISSKAGLQAKTGSEPEPQPKPELKTEAKPADKASNAADEAARARALLNGQTPASAANTASAAKTASATKVASATKTASAANAATPAAADSSRFVVQVGAFNDGKKAREVRLRLERAGIKTYITVVKKASVEWTRVRVGPFGVRAEAERMAAKVKGMSMSAVVLTL